MTIKNNLNKKLSAVSKNGSAKNLTLGKKSSARNQEKKLEVPLKQISDQRRSSALIWLPSISRLRAGVNSKP